jgi:ABC-type glutathione transport system ATPase component
VSSAVLSVRDLRKSYRRPSGEVIPAVDGVSFELAGGETLGWVGESGCGKSTLARLLLRLEEPDSGRIEVLGRDWLALPPRELRRERRHIQIVFQDPVTSLDPRRPIGETVGEPLEGAGIPPVEIAPRVASALEEVGLDAAWAARLPAELSGGERQRVAIARAIVGEPRILVCDEPLSALDVETAGSVRGLLARLRAGRGLALLFISHDIGSVLALCDRIAVMRFGRVVEEGPAEAVRRSPADPYTAALLSGSEIAYSSKL